MFPLLTLVGTPLERGRQYGTHAAELIRHSIASYARLFAYRRGMDWAEIQAAALAYVPLLADLAPDLLAEMQGIAEGSGLDLAAIVALNARTELLGGGLVGVGNVHPGYAAAMARNQAARVPQHTAESTAADSSVAHTLRASDFGECTTVAVQPSASANGHTWLAQTWDWNGDQRGACVLLQISAPGQPTILTLTEAGILAKIGLNSAGLGVSLNILRSVADGAVPGMPVHVLLRQVLQQESVAAALDLVQHTIAGASSCITVADASGAALSLELTPQGVGVLSAEAGMLAHTNHCILSETRAGECSLETSPSSVPRYDRALALLQAQRSAIDLAALQQLLRDHENAPLCICRHPDTHLAPAERIESVTAVVMDLPQRVMYVAPDLPCRVPFTAIPLPTA